MADGGTLFLDEIGEIPLSLQAKFLYAVQEEEIMPIGGSRPMKLDVRIISATNCDLGIMVEAGRFRGDLYHRLNVFEVTIPPLRERPQDLSLMAHHFVNTYNYKYKKVVRLSAEVMEAFRNYDWKGNLRELSNVLERGILLAKGNELQLADLPASFFKVDNRVHQNGNGIGCAGLRDIMYDFEGRIIRQTYDKCGSTRAMAKALNISQSTAHRLVQKYVCSFSGPTK
jgi:transcriptional regulator with PAS, ATPase and Fis domain